MNEKHPTPQQVEAYLNATGWTQVEGHALSDVADLWAHDEYGTVCFYRDQLDANDSFLIVGRAEGRPSEGDLVRGDMLAIIPCDCGEFEYVHPLHMHRTDGKEWVRAKWRSMQQAFEAGYAAAQRALLGDDS